jgi:processive 1,2-diacylglycerol beta-glucosyltransferase
MDMGEVVVVSGSYGAGHDAVADELARRLRAQGRPVRRLDIVDELPWRLGPILRWLYFAQLRFAPRSWGSTLRRLERDGWTTRLVTVLLGLLGNHLVRTVTGAELVVSTHPFASQVLGAARARGRLGTPVATDLTDASVHRLWVHPGVDLHLAIHDVTAAQARAWGVTTTVVAPLVAVPVRAPDGPPPWPVAGPVALLVGGSCGVGELEEAAHDVAETGLMTPVVACGHNDRLRDRLAAVEGVVALGWRDDLPALVAAADCVLQNAGGMTSLESLAAGTPTFTYRPIPGHGVTNAEALDTAGLVSWVRDQAGLHDALAQALVTGSVSSLPAGAPDVLDALSGVLGPVPAEPLLELVGA